MSSVISPQITTKYPLPRVVCDDCGKLCVYKKYSDVPDDKSWLECTGCRKQWDNISLAIEQQDKMLDDVTCAIQDITLSAQISAQSGMSSKMWRLLCGIGIHQWDKWSQSPFSVYRTRKCLHCNLIVEETLTDREQL